MCDSHILTYFRIFSHISQGWPIMIVVEGSTGQPKTNEVFVCRVSQILLCHPLFCSKWKLQTLPHIKVICQ